MVEVVGEVAEGRYSNQDYNLTTNYMVCILSKSSMVQYKVL